MAAGDIFLLRTQYRSHARLWTINQHYKDITGITDLEAAADLTDAWDAAYRVNVLAHLATDSTFESIYSVKLTGGDAMPSLDVRESHAGTASGDSLPPNNAMVVSLQSTDPLLKRTGRLYVAGIPKGQIVNGNVAGGFLTTFTAVWDAIGKDTLNGALGDWKPQVFRTIDNGIPLTPPFGVDVTSTRITGILYSQRRRNSRQQGST